MNYLIYNSTGEILSTGACDAAHPPTLKDGEFLFEGEAGLYDTFDVATNTVITGGQAPEPIVTPTPQPYIQLRKRAYPPVEKQLDVFWHAMDSGNFPKLEPWYSQIKSIKNSYPKAVDVASDAGNISETL
jgi:hypothetical protein